jgi:hypothetical protein
VGTHAEAHYPCSSGGSTCRCEANEARADERAAKLAPIIKALQAEGIASLNGIAEALNERRVPTSRGRGHWYVTQVRRVLARLA